MVQTVKSGRAGNNFGHRMGKYAAEHLGTELIAGSAIKSNEAILDGERIVIKSAHKTNNRIGVPHNVLDRITGIIAVLENKNSPNDGVHKYTVYRIDSEYFKKEMRPDCKRENVGHMAGGKIRQHGKKIKELSCDF